MKLHLIYLLISITTLPQFSQTISYDQISDRFKPAVQAGILKDSLLQEASGLVASIKNKGYYWVINDSGNDPRLFLIDGKGIIAKSFLISGCENLDWEDIAIRTDPAGRQPRILIGDIGDNFARRDHIRLISLPEPVLAEGQSEILEDLEVYNFRYEDGARDAETLLTDPWSNAVYVITKREEQVRMYITPVSWSQADTMNLTLQASLPFRYFTAGDISMDGTEILLKSYREVFYWKRKNPESLEETLAKKPELLKYDPEPQGESICWSLDGNRFFTLSEKSFAAKQALYFYERKGK